MFSARCENCSCARCESCSWNRLPWLDAKFLRASSRARCALSTALLHFGSPRTLDPFDVRNPRRTSFDRPITIAVPPIIVTTTICISTKLARLKSRRRPTSLHRSPPLPTGTQGHSTPYPELLNQRTNRNPIRVTRYLYAIMGPPRLPRIDPLSIPTLCYRSKSSGLRMFHR